MCVTPSASRAAPFKPHSICRSDGKWARGAQHRAPRFSVKRALQQTTATGQGAGSQQRLCYGTFFRAQIQQSPAGAKWIGAG